MKERFAQVVFYTVMSLVTATCVAELGTYTVLSKADWFSGWGSWASGAGTFVAAGVALLISSKDRRERKAERDREMRFRRHFAVYRLLLYTEDLKQLLRKIDIGKGVPRATWCAIHNRDDTPPIIALSERVTEVPGVMYLGMLCQDAIDVERRVHAHNEYCKTPRTEINMMGMYDFNNKMRKKLEALYQVNEDLRNQLTRALAEIQVSQAFEV